MDISVVFGDGNALPNVGVDIVKLRGKDGMSDGLDWLVWAHEFK